MKIIFLFFILFTSLFSRDELNIPKERIPEFNKLKEAIYIQPFNHDLLLSLTKIIDEDKVNLLRNDTIVSLLKFIYINSNAKETKAIAYKYISQYLSDSTSANDKKFYSDKTFKPNFETLLFYHMSNDPKTIELKSKLEASKIFFYPTDSKEIFFKTLYYTFTGDYQDAEDGLKEIEPRLKHKKNFIDKQKAAISAEKDKNKNNRFFKVKEFSIDQESLYLGYLCSVSSFLFDKLGNKEKSEYYRNFSKEILQDNNLYYFYMLSTLSSVSENYDNSLEYMFYVSKMTDYSTIKNELFITYVLASNFEFKQKRYEKAWLDSKEGVLLGKTLDYNRFYKNVISLKKILKASSISYANILLSKGDTEGARRVLRDSDFILKDVQ